MDVILHLGGHRCGTTTLQRYLAKNRSALADAGVVAWGPKTTRNGLFAGLVQRPAAITPAIARRGLRSCGLIAMAIHELAGAGYRDLIISDENMLGTIRANLQDRAFYPDALQRLARFTSAVGADPRRIGMCIRGYDRLWASALAYQIGRGYPVPDTTAIQALVDQPRRWRDLIGDIAAVFPRTEIVVWPFERFAGQPDIQLTLLTGGLRFNPGLAGARDWVNRSPDRLALRAQVAERGETPAIGFEGTGRWMPFDAGQQAKLRNDYAADIAWLRGGADGMATFIEIPTDDQSAKTIKTSGFAAHDRHRGSQNGLEKIVG